MDQRCHPAARCDQEGEQQPCPLVRRSVRAGTTYQEQQVWQAGPVEAVAVTPHREVVAEPLAELVGVGMTADPEHQVRVVHALPLTGVQVEPVRQQRGDPCRAQYVLRGQSETQVDRDRQRCEDLRPLGPRGPAPSTRRRHGRSVARTPTARPHPHAVTTQRPQRSTRSQGQSAASQRTTGSARGTSRSDLSARTHDCTVTSGAPREVVGVTATAAGRADRAEEAGEPEAGSRTRQSADVLGARSGDY